MPRDNYSAPLGECSIAISLSACVSVCPPAYIRNHWTNLLEFFCADPLCHGSVLLWQHCDTLCTSGFMDASRLTIMGRLAMHGVALRYRGGV